MDKRKSALKNGILSAVVIFLLLSVFVGSNSLIIISSEVGTTRWMFDTFIYALGAKFFSKLAASCVVGLVVGFVSGMIDYGRKLEHPVKTEPAKTAYQPVVRHEVGKIA